MDNGWRKFEEKPDRPLQAELFSGRLYLTDEDGEKISAVVHPWRDERRQMAFFDGECWRHMGTGHELFEYGEPDKEYLPTHWRELGPVPRGFEP